MEREENSLAVAGSAASIASSRLIVCEQTGRWAVALRRELAGAGVRVWETRTLAGCREELEHSPASFIALEVSDDLPGLLRFMVRQTEDFPAARLAAVADSARRDCEWLMREAGAVHFVTSVRQVGLLARLACRHLAQAPPPQLSLTERIWTSLPWGERS